MIQVERSNKTYIPGCQHDIFISYAHFDNEPLAQGKEGWISFLHTALRVRLRQLLGADLDIWRDPKLHGNDYLGDTLLNKISQVATLVSVLSPRYIQSDWCLREMKGFCATAVQRGDLRIGDKARLFKVIKTPISLYEHPEELQGLRGYEFFETNPQTGQPLEFRPELGLEAERKFFSKLEDLAFDIHHLFKLLQTQGTSAPPPSTNSATVYLAETTSDLNDSRDKIRRELLARDYTVLPDTDLPITNIAALYDKIRQALAKSKLSIHLIGRIYGLVPEGESRSLIEIQNELAADLAPRVSRLIWLPSGLQTSDQRQEQLIRTLRNGEYVHDSMDLLETSLDELKDTILKKLRDGKNGATGVPAPSGPTRVYLICDKQDLAAARPVADHLFDRGFEVEWPAFDGNETALCEAHQDKMVLCDAVLIFCGESSDTWFSSKTKDLVKAYGWEPKKRPYTAQAIYFAAPQNDFKERYRSHQSIVIKNFAAFVPEVLNEFVAALRKGGGN